MLQHRGTQIIETERLILRPFVPEDAQAMFDRWASHDCVTRYLTWPTHSDAAVTKAVLGDWVGNYQRADCYNWAIVLKDLDEKPIGNISVVSYKHRAESAEMGYCMAPAHWGKGIMAEALRAVTGYLFETVGFNRIEAMHATNNPGSGRVMEKAGMTCEGTLRQGGWCNQGIVDLKVYAILKADWQR